MPTQLSLKFQEHTNDERLFVRKANGRYRPASTEEIIQAALQTINARFIRGVQITSPADTHDFMKLQLAHLEHEIFAVLWLDNRHRVLAFEELFRGTLDGASVYPREVLKSALAHNAAACILAHNHPSGVEDPSPADRQITARIKEALNLIGVRTLDHVIVAENTFSFAEHNLI